MNLAYYAEYLIDIFPFIGNFWHLVLTAELILYLHPFVECTLFDAMNRRFAEHFGIIPFVEII